jgi:hypothetical protein
MALPRRTNFVVLLILRLSRSLLLKGLFPSSIEQ